MSATLKEFEDHRLLAVIRSSSPEDAEAMIKAAGAGGFWLFEISVQTPQAVRLIESYSKKEGFLIGAGTVTDGEMAQRAINAGARFISTHYTDKDVINVAKNNDSFVIAGALTPTEAVNAYQLGADLVRIYPAVSIGGPVYLKSLRANLPSIKFMASGGVGLENAFEHLRYCVAVSFRKSLFDMPLVRSDNWGEITERAKQLTQKLESLKVVR